MAATVVCLNCGDSIAVPPSFTRPKIRCLCGYYVEVQNSTDTRADALQDAPRDATTASITPRDTAKALAKRPSIAPQMTEHDPRPRFLPPDSAEVPNGEPILVGSQNEDDDQPYGVPGSGLKQCLHCRFELPLDAVLCVHCGKDLVSGVAVKKVKQPMHGIWMEGFSKQTRLQILTAFMVLNLLGTIVVMLQQSASLSDPATFLTFAFYQAVTLGMQLFLVGTYDTLIVERNKKGRAKLTRVRRIAFYPLAPQKIDWKESTNLSIIGATASGIVEWWICAYLTLCLFVIPGVLFYIYVILPSRYHVHITDVYGATTEIIFRTKDRQVAEEVSFFVSEATGLKYRTG